MRHLASIQQVRSIHPIEGKDRIVLAEVLGWTVIVQKNEYKPGDKCIYVEVDSVLPERPEFEFLRKKDFRIKTMKMAGVLSQGICFPLSLLPEGRYEEGDDVTELLGITKYDEYHDEVVSDSKKEKSALRQFMFRHRITRPIAKLIWMPTKRERDGFPDFVSKTDETRIQNIPYILDNKDIKWVGREKIDGQSGTFFLRRMKNPIPFLPDRFDFGVCSRNRRLMTDDGSTFWQVAKKYNIRKVLEQMICDEDWVCIQGEVIGPKVQGNKYHVNEPDLYCFNLIYPGRKVPCFTAEDAVGVHGLKWVPMVVSEYTLPDTVHEVLDFATGESALYPTLREGIVFRNYKTGQSFKAVSNEFLLHHKL